MSSNLTDGIVRILRPDKRTAGTGFVIREDGLIATCAHVVIDAKAGPGGTVSLVFLASKAKEIRTAVVEAECWCDPDKGEDIAILRLQGSLPKEVVPLPLGSSVHSGDHNFSTFGFPELNSLEGMRGGGKVLGLKPQEGFSVLQLRSEEVAQGFSGAPVWDNTSQVVIGMVTRSMENREVKIGSHKFTIPSDHNWRFLYAAFATPTETLREVYPELQVSRECPYRQLVAFTEADARFFCGRDIFIETLLKRLHDSPRFLAVFGPSGSGKSSVVRAGLISKLREGAMLGSDHWKINIVRPADDPFRLLIETSPVNSDNLTQRADAWLEQQPERTNRFVLVVDQFEELLASKDLEPSIFITRLTDLLDRSPRVTLIIVMRDDFYSQFVGQEILRKWLDNSNGAVNIPPALTCSELEAIIREPAKRANIYIQDGLVDLLVKDASGEGEQEARSTILPLLEFTLTRLWEKRQNETLTLDEYNFMHGIKDEFTSWANITYDTLEAELPSEYRHLIQRIFTDLVHIGDENLHLPNSRQRKSQTSLCRDESELKPIQEIVNKLVNARLLVEMLVENEEMVEIIHDVLINEWGYLNSWIKDNRAFLTWHQKLEERVQEWTATNVHDPAKRDEYKLFGGRDLIAAEEWLTERKAELSTLEQDFIQASRERQRKTEERQRREVRRLRFFVAVLSIFSVAVIVLGSLAGWALVQANQQTKIANFQTQIAISRALAEEANNALLNNRLDLALLLSVEASRVANSDEARDSLLTSLEHSSQIATILRSDVGRMRTLMFTSDSQTLLSAGDDSFIPVLWDITARKARHLPFVSHQQEQVIVAISPDGQVLASAGETGLRLWNTRTGMQLAQLEGQGRVLALAFSPGGKLLASGDASGVITLWDVTTGKRIGQPFPGNTRPVWRIVFSQDEKRLAIGTCDSAYIWDSVSLRSCLQLSGQIVVWDIATGKPLGLTLAVDSAEVRSVAFSPDGRMLALGNKKGTIVLRDVATGQQIGQPLTGHTAEVRSVAFSPDGRMLASGSFDDTVRLWDTTTGQQIGQPLTGHSAEVRSVAFSPDGRMAASGSSDGVIILWKVVPDNITILKQTGLRDIGFPYSSAISPDGKLVAIGGDTLWLWDATTGRRIKQITASRSGSLSSVAFSPDGQTLAVGNLDGSITLWDIATDKPIGLPFMGQGGGVWSVAFSPDGQTLASATREGGTITLWDIASRKPIKVLHQIARSLAFHPSRQILASGNLDGSVTLWNIATGKPIGLPLKSQAGDVWSVAFSPDGKELASDNQTEEGGDIMITVWSLETPTPTPLAHPFIDNHSELNVIMFGPSSGQLLALTTRVLLGASDNTGSYIVTRRDSTVDVWQANACSIANRNLTQQEWQKFVKDKPYRKVCPDLPT